MGQSSWLVSGMVPGVERQPLKKLEPDEDQLLKLMNRWRHEALQAGHAIERVVVAYEAGRDGFWCAPTLRRDEEWSRRLGALLSMRIIASGSCRPTAYKYASVIIRHQRAPLGIEACEIRLGISIRALFS